MARTIGIAVLLVGAVVVTAAADDQHIGDWYWVVTWSPTTPTYSKSETITNQLGTRAPTGDPTNTSCWAKVEDNAQHDTTTSCEIAVTETQSGTCNWEWRSLEAQWPQHVVYDLHSTLMDMSQVELWASVNNYGTGITDKGFAKASCHNQVDTSQVNDAEDLTAPEHWWNPDHTQEFWTPNCHKAQQQEMWGTSQTYNQITGSKTSSFSVTHTAHADRSDTTDPPGCEAKADIQGGGGFNMMYTNEQIVWD